MKTLLDRSVAALTFGGLLALQSTLSAQSIQPTRAEVRYGKYDRNVLDVYQSKTAHPAPVLIYFHGGGWLGGDKRNFNSDPMLNPDFMLKKGIAVVAANYRFTTGTRDAAPFPAPMLDSARAVQFVRSKAKEWNLDPNRVALAGTSSGAVICMWIAYHEDLAKPGSADPVERFSTRVTCIAPQSGPTTLDPKQILQRIGGDRSVTSALLPFFGVKSLEELEAPDKQRLVADASPLTHVTRNAPPTFMQYVFPLGGTPLPENTPINHSIHHPEFGVMLKEKLDAAGVENVLQTAGDGSDPQALATFLIKHLNPIP